MPRAAMFEVWAWVLIYGGLASVVLGLFVQRGGGERSGWLLVGLGSLLVPAGVLLIYLRSRLPAPSAKLPAPKSPGVSAGNANKDV